MNVYRYIYQIQRTSIVQDDTRSGGNVFRRTMEKRGIGVAIDLFRFLERSEKEITNNRKDSKSI